MKRSILALVALSSLPLPVFAQNTDSVGDLDNVKVYLIGKVEELAEGTGALNDAAQAYYTLAEAADFDYTALYANDTEAVQAIIEDAREAWITASPLYEQMEGIVAGVPSLAEYDVILDAGVSGEEDPEGGVMFDLTLPDGRILERPGNLFGVLESTLWGTREAYSSGIEAELNGDADDDFGDLLPDANVLLAAAETMNNYVTELGTSAEAWQPNETDAFTALVVMVPTMSEYFGSWKESRFIAGEEGSSEFAVISRLSDIQDILGGLEVVYEGVQPRIAETGEDNEAQIREGLESLQEYVGDLYEREQDGTVFTAEQADFFGSEAQDQAMTITGQIAQAAALLDIELPE